MEKNFDISKIKIEKTNFYASIPKKTMKEMNMKHNDILLFIKESGTIKLQKIK